MGDDDRMKSTPKWVNPCGLSGDYYVDSAVDVVQIGDAQLLSQIETQAKTALTHARILRDDYVSGNDTQYNNNASARLAVFHDGISFTVPESKFRICVSPQHILSYLDAANGHSPFVHNLVLTRCECRSPTLWFCVSLYLRAKREQPPM